MNADEFHIRMATGYFKPIYPVIARNALKKCSKKKGVCVDIGCGSGVLGVEIAKISQFTIINIDPDKRFIELSEDYARSNNMHNRIKSVTGIAENIFLDSFSVDLVVSRGSLYFWTDKVKAINEIYRVLKPGGVAYIGGGMGSTSLGKKISAQLSDDNKWGKDRDKRFRKNLPLHHKLLMRKTGIDSWEIEASQEGTWIIITKTK